MKILIVSRDERHRAWMRAALDASWTLRDARDGVEALRMVRAASEASRKARGSASEANEPISLVITDENAQPFGAFGLSRELKNLESAPRVLVLLDRSQDTWLAKWSGADRWLVKPADPFEVRAVAEELAALGPEDAPRDLLLGDPSEGVTESEVAQAAAEVYADTD